MADWIDRLVIREKAKAYTRLELDSWGFRLNDLSLDVAVNALKECFDFFEDRTLDDWSGGIGLTWEAFVGLAALGAADDHICTRFGKLLIKTGGHDAEHSK